ncbi:MAG: class I SAM-dependent methyltransferase [Promethearchaeota archaeon]|nr:MAG: class I SAM-dependent methyltransferase [Candidatus Lokiarchaeota archaeon]
MDIKEAKEILGNEISFIFDFIDPIIKSLNLEKEAKILDVGTGKGRMAILLALNNYYVLTGEPEGDNTEYAKRDWLANAKKVNIDHLITFIHFNAEDMPFDNETFDAIFLQGALHHIDNKFTAFKEFIRITKPKGLICIFEPTPKGIEAMRKRFPSHPEAVDPRVYAKNFNLSVEVKNGPIFDAFIFKKNN